MENRKLSVSQSCYPMVRSQHNNKKIKKLRRKWTKLNENTDARQNFDDNEEFINNYSNCDDLGETIKYPYKNVKFNTNIYHKPTKKLKRTMTQLRFNNYNEVVEPCLDECYDSQGYFVGYLPAQLLKPYPSQMFFPDDPDYFNFPDQIHPQANVEHFKCSKYYNLQGLNKVPHNMDYNVDHFNVRSCTSSKGKRKRKKRYPVLSSRHYDDGYITTCHEWEDIAYVQDEPSEAKEVNTCQLERSHSLSTRLVDDDRSDQSTKESIASVHSTSDKGCDSSQRSVLLKNFKDTLETEDSKVFVEIIIPKKDFVDTEDKKPSEASSSFDSKVDCKTEVSLHSNEIESVEKAKSDKSQHGSDRSISLDGGDGLSEVMETAWKSTAFDDKFDDATEKKTLNEEKISFTKTVVNQSKELTSPNTPSKIPTTSFAVEEKKIISCNGEVLYVSDTGKDVEMEIIDSPRTENQSMFGAISDPNKKYDSDETLSNHEQDPFFNNYNNLLKYSAKYQGIYNSNYKQVKFGVFTVLYKTFVERGFLFVGNVIKHWLDSFVKQSYTLGFKDHVETASSIKHPKQLQTDKNTQYPESEKIITEMKMLEYKGENLKDLKLPEVCKICLRCAEKRRQKGHRCTNMSHLHGEDPKYDWLKKYPIDCIYLKVAKSNGEHSFINPITKQEVKIYPMKDLKIRKGRGRSEIKKSGGFDADLSPDKHTAFMQNNANLHKTYSLNRSRSTANEQSRSVYSMEDGHSMSSETDGTYILENLQSPSA